MVALVMTPPPWYRQIWPWLLMLGPGIVVIAGFITLWLAITSFDGLVADDYYKKGLGVNQDLSRRERADFITSLHTPACTLPEADHAMLFSAADLALRVSNPGGHEFRLETSPMEGGRYLEGCARCVHRPRCGGLRDDYLAAHGAQEFVPVTA